MRCTTAARNVMYVFVFLLSLFGGLSLVNNRPPLGCSDGGAELSKPPRSELKDVEQNLAAGFSNGTTTPTNGTAEGTISKCKAGVSGELCNRCDNGFGPMFPTCTRRCTARDCHGRGKASGFYGSCTCSCPPVYCGFYCEHCCHESCRTQLQAVNYGLKYPIISQSLLVPEAESLDKSAPDYPAINGRGPVTIDAIIPRNRTLFLIERSNSKCYEVTGGVLFEICYESGHLLTDTMAMRVTDRKFIDVSSMMYSVHRMANESLGWHRTTAEQFARLGAHVYPSNLSTWHATSSSSLSGKVFWLTHHTSRFSGHYFLGVITLLGKLLYHYGAASADISIVLFDPAGQDFGIPATHSAELVYWIFKYLNMNLYFIPRKTVVYAETVIFAIGDQHTAFGNTFMQQVIWPRVRDHFRGVLPTTYRRLAFIKPNAQPGGSGRGYVVSDSFRETLEEAGYTLISTDVPSDERMWYVNHADQLLISWGSLVDVILSLRVENRQAVVVRFLLHSGYAHENHPHGPIVQKGNVSLSQSFLRENDNPLLRKPMIAMQVRDDNLNHLTVDDLLLS